MRKLPMCTVKGIVCCCCLVVLSLINMPHVLPTVHVHIEIITYKCPPQKGGEHATRLFRPLRLGREKMLSYWYGKQTLAVLAMVAVVEVGVNSNFVFFSPYLLCFSDPRSEDGRCQRKEHTVRTSPFRWGVHRPVGNCPRCSRSRNEKTPIT